MTKQKGHDYSTLLIWSAAVVTVVRYAAAFIASDIGQITGILSEVITILMGISGLGMGILDVIGGTYLFDGWRRKMPANGQAWNFKFKVLTVFVFALIATGVFILVPFTVSRVTHTSLADVLDTKSGLTFWAFLVNVAPYLLVGGVAVGNQIVSVSSEESYRKVSAGDSESSDKVTVSWRKIRKTLTDEQIRGIAVDQTKNIAFNFKIDERTARNWRKYAQEEIKK